MANSKSIAKIIGPTACALTVSESLKLHICNVDIPTVTCLNGLLPLVAGLPIVVAHDHWKRSEPVVVTMTGWRANLGDLYRMSFPEAPEAPRDDRQFSYPMSAGKMIPRAKRGSMWPGVIRTAEPRTVRLRVVSV